MPDADLNLKRRYVAVCSTCVSMWDSYLRNPMIAGVKKETPCYLCGNPNRHAESLVPVGVNAIGKVVEPSFARKDA